MHHYYLSFVNHQKLTPPPQHFPQAKPKPKPSTRFTHFPAFFRDFGLCSDKKKNMASILGSQGVVLATAMAVSGTVILLAIRLQKSLPLDQIPQPSQQALRPCISSEAKKREKKKKKKKRVHFAEDVMDPRGDGEEFRRQLMMKNNSAAVNSSPEFDKMPANRVALYNGILRDRVVQRLAYSYQAK